jgi:peptide/nickel transport system permease protein
MALPADAVAADAVATPILVAPTKVRRGPGNLPLYIPLGIFVLITLAAFFAPWLFHLPPWKNASLLDVNLGPFQQGHLLGTDALGDDLLSRSLVGAQVSIVVGFCVAAAGALIGSALGITAGYFGGLSDIGIMRVIDIQLTFPALILALLISEYLGASELHEGIALTVISIPIYARLSRAATLRIREREFVISTRIMGARTRHITMRHVFPNVVPVLITIFPITVSTVMLIEATLSFLGAGIKPPQPSLGNMIYAGVQTLETHPIGVIVPSVFLFVIVCCLNLIGEQVRLRWGR